MSIELIELMLILNIWQHLYFIDKGFKSQPNVCTKCKFQTRCHDLLMVSMNLTNKVYDDCCIISGISKSEVVSLM